MKFNKNIIGWIVYDFANSSFTTIIVTVIYSVYFKNVVAGGSEYGTALWGRAVSLSLFLVAISSPILGAIADHSRTKKKFLFFNCYLTVIFTSLLYLIGVGDIFKGLLFFVIANYAFNSGNVFYNAFLPEISTEKNIGKISGYGYALGYVGGLLSLLICLPLLKIDVRLVFPAVGLFFGISAIWTFILLREKTFSSKRTNYFKTAYRRIKHTFINISKYKELTKFLFAYFIYNDGIVVVISFSAIFGATQFGMNFSQLIIYFIVAQLSSIFGASFFGIILDKIGAKRTISIALLIWIFVVIWVFFSKTIVEFYIIGGFAGIAIGSSQSASRTLLAKLTPKNKSAEFFGFYSFTGKFSSIAGPFIYGEIARITNSQRYSVLSILLFFVAGIVILQLVKNDKN